MGGGGQVTFHVISRWGGGGHWIKKKLGGGHWWGGEGSLDLNFVRRGGGVIQKFG